MCTESANMFLLDGVCVCVWCNTDAHVFLSKMHTCKIHVYILEVQKFLKNLGATWQKASSIVKIHKFLGTNAQNLVTMTTWHQDL